MRCLIAICFILSVPLEFFAQDRYTPGGLIPICKKGKWGYCDTAKIIKIPCKYQMAYPFYKKDESGNWKFSSTGIVQLKDKFYLIDEKGKLSEKRDYLSTLEDIEIRQYKTIDEELPESELKKDYPEFIDDKGNKYKLVSEYEYMLVISNDNHKFGVVEKRLKKIIVPVENDSIIIPNPREAYLVAFVKKDKMWGMFFGNRKVIDYEFSKLDYINQSIYDPMLFLIVGEKNGKVLFVDPRGNILPWGQFDDIKITKYYLYAWSFVVKKGGKWGAINNNGKNIVPFEYDYIDEKYSEARLLFVQKKNIKGFIDLRGVKYF